MEKTDVLRVIDYFHTPFSTYNW